MNTCIKCGKQIPDGDLFCPECSMTPLSKPQKSAKKSAGTFQKPRTNTINTPQPAAQPQKKRSKLTLILALLLAVFVGISAYYFVTVTQQRIALRLREASVHAQEAEYAEKDAQLEALSAQIKDLEAELSRKNEQIATLTQTITSAESSASQHEYDLKAQQSEYEKLQEQYDALKEEYDALQLKYDTLEGSVSDLQKKSKFMDDYVVFVENDGTGYYHKYGCSSFAHKTFWAYSRKLAESSGFAACPYCMD